MKWLLSVIFFISFFNYGKDVDGICQKIAKQGAGDKISFPKINMQSAESHDRAICWQGKDIKHYVAKKLNIPDYDSDAIIVTSSWAIPQNNKAYFTILNISNGISYIGSIAIGDGFPLKTSLVSIINLKKTNPNALLVALNLKGLGLSTNKEYHYVFFNVTVEMKDGSTEFLGGYRFLDKKNDDNDVSDLKKITDGEINYVRDDGTLTIRFLNEKDNKYDGELIDNDGQKLCDLDTTLQGWAVWSECIN
ncbi:hypothetical protein [Yersinia intermedia]|uniref:hypothetical protein n=1 Tax=Yersinia intermedia TaxID=631 RepID=UPI0030CBC0FE